MQKRTTKPTAWLQIMETEILKQKLEDRSTLEITDDERERWSMKGYVCDNSRYNCIIPINDKSK